MQGVDAGRLEACHWLLLRLAGAVPDELITLCRSWLGRGRAVDVAQTVVHAALGYRLRLTEADVALLADVFAAARADTSGLTMVAVAEVNPMPGYAFVADRRLAFDRTLPAADTVPPAGDHGATILPRSDLDRVDRAAVRVAARQPLVRALWRAWRCLPGAKSGSAPRRVVVVECAAGHDLAALTARFGRALADAGEVNPQVEVYAYGPAVPEVPAYQRLARDYGALLWAGEPDRELRLARFPGHIAGRSGRAWPNFAVAGPGTRRCGRGRPNGCWRTSTVGGWYCPRPTGWWT